MSRTAIAEILLTILTTMHFQTVINKKGLEKVLQLQIGSRGLCPPNPRYCWEIPSNPVKATPDSPNYARLQDSYYASAALLVPEGEGKVVIAL